MILKLQTEKSNYCGFADNYLEFHGKLKIRSHNLKTETTELLYTKWHLSTVQMRYFAAGYGLEKRPILNASFGVFIPMGIE